MNTAALAYTPFGYIDSHDRMVAKLGFNGEPQDQLFGLYPLGQGYRNYSPTLMRFHKPDNLSPFGQGGYNAYAYCKGDPVNFRDDTGHTRTFAQLRKFWSEKSASTQPPTPPLKEVRKRKVRFSKKITGVIYTNELDVRKGRLLEEQQSLQAYIQKFTKRIERKMEDFNLLMKPSTPELPKHFGISAERYQAALESLETWIYEALRRVENLNVTLRSYLV